MKPHTYIYMVFINIILVSGNNWCSENPSNDICYYPSKIVINNYENTKLDIIQKPFSSACVKCIICLTISNQIHSSLSKAHYYQLFSIFDKEMINKTLTKICELGFKDYDLREYRHGYRCLALPSTGTKHITSNMDGLWIHKLKETCYLYINHYGIQNLYMVWLEDFKMFQFNLSKHLCRSFGLFGHCKNIRMDETYNEKYSLISASQIKHNCIET